MTPHLTQPVEGGRPSEAQRLQRKGYTLREIARMTGEDYERIRFTLYDKVAADKTVEPSRPQVRYAGAEWR